MDEKILISLGLNKGEINIYEAIVKAKEISSVELAKVTGIKRTTVYSIARSLIEKGLIFEDSLKRPKVFVASGSEEINAEIELEKKRSDERQKMLTELGLAVDKQGASETLPVPTVRFIEETKIESYLKKNASVWVQNSIEQNEFTWWGWQDHTFVEHYGDWIEWYWERWDEKMDLRLLSNRASVEVEFAKKNAHRTKRNIKFWGEALNFYSSTWVAGDYIVMINTRSRPFYLVEIRDKLMAHDQREIFKNLWDMI